MKRKKIGLREHHFVPLKHCNPLCTVANHCFVSPAFARHTEIILQALGANLLQNCDASSIAESIAILLDWQASNKIEDFMNMFSCLSEKFILSAKAITLHAVTMFRFSRMTISWGGGINDHLIYAIPDLFIMNILLQ